MLQLQMWFKKDFRRFQRAKSKKDKSDTLKLPLFGSKNGSNHKNLLYTTLLCISNRDCFQLYTTLLCISTVFKAPTHDKDSKRGNNKPTYPTEILWQDLKIFLLSNMIIRQQWTYPDTEQIHQSLVHLRVIC